MTTTPPPPTASAAAAGPPARPSGWITLARHGEPALSRRVRLSAQGYRDWWARYEVGGLKAGQTPPEGLKRLAREAELIFSSTRPRAIETAAAVAEGRPVPACEDLVEAPLPPPPWRPVVQLPPRLWGVLARAWWWFFDHHEGQETKAQAQARAAAAADRLTAEAEAGRDVLVLAHGFFNGMVGAELTKRGWRCVHDEGFKYWSARRFEKRG